MIKTASLTQSWFTVKELKADRIKIKWGFYRHRHHLEDVFLDIFFLNLWHTADVGNPGTSHQPQRVPGAETWGVAPWHVTKTPLTFRGPRAFFLGSWNTMILHFPGSSGWNPCCWCFHPMYPCTFDYSWRRRQRHFVLFKFSEAPLASAIGPGRRELLFNEVLPVQSTRWGRQKERGQVPTFLRPLLWCNAESTGLGVPGPGYMQSDSILPPN